MVSLKFKLQVRLGLGWRAVAQVCWGGGGGSPVEEEDFAMKTGCAILSLTGRLSRISCKAAE